MTRYIIYGAGAIGSILGARLFRTGHEVVLVGRREHVQAIRRHGLQLHHQGQIHGIRVNAVETLAQIKPHAEDRLLITLKAQQTLREVDVIAQVYPPHTPVVSFQNAVNNEELLARRFSSVYGGLVDFSGTFIQPGVIHFTRNNLLAIGRYPAGLDDMAQSTATDLEAAGFQAERTLRIMDLKWWKLVINTSNALLAIIDCWVQRAHSDPIVSPLVAGLLEEGLTVLQCARISTQSPWGTPPLDDTIARLRAGRMGLHRVLSFEDRTYPSTWQDLHLKRGSTEADLFNGEIIRLGKQWGVPTPLNSLLLEIVEPMARNKEAPGKYTPEEMTELFKKAKTS